LQTDIIAGQFSGKGSDTYQAGYGDTIKDSDGNGVVFFNGKQLKGGTKSGENEPLFEHKYPSQ
jgi:hypothetical protein